MEDEKELGPIIPTLRQVRRLTQEMDERSSHHLLRI